MSVARWTKYSQVYVFYTDAGVECHECTLSPREEPFVAPTLSKMIHHLQAHREAGHKVPTYAFRQLLSDLLKNGDAA